MEFEQWLEEKNHKRKKHKRIEGWCPLERVHTTLEWHGITRASKSIKGHDENGVYVSRTAHTNIHSKAPDDFFKIYGQPLSDYLEYISF